MPYGQQTQYGQPPGLPTSSSLPPGWTQLWDQSSQRWYYTESATCRTQWDPPVYSPPPQGGFLPLGHENDRRGSFGYNPPPPGALPTTGQYGQLQSGEEKKIDKKSHGGLIAGAAGGLVVGAVGGALVGSALSTYHTSYIGPHVLGIYFFSKEWQINVSLTIPNPPPLQAIPTPMTNAIVEW